MKPIKIPANWADDANGRHVRMVDAPRGMQNCSPVEMMIDAPHGEPEVFSALVELDPEDFLKLEANSGRFWVSFWGSHLHPFSVSTLDFEGLETPDDPYAQLLRKLFVFRWLHAEARWWAEFYQARFEVRRHLTRKPDDLDIDEPLPWNKAANKGGSAS